MNNHQIENTDSLELIRIADRIIVELARRGADDPIFRRVKRFPPEMPGNNSRKMVKYKTDSEPIFCEWNSIKRVFQMWSYDEDSYSDCLVDFLENDVEWWCEL